MQDLLLLWREANKEPIRTLFKFRNLTKKSVSSPSFAKKEDILHFFLERSMKLKMWNSATKCFQNCANFCKCFMNELERMCLGCILPTQELWIRRAKYVYCMWTVACLYKTQFSHPIFTNWIIFFSLIKIKFSN